jgi:hypothetical protein
MLRMSVPSFKLLLHSARARLKEIGSVNVHAAGTRRGSVVPSPPGQLRHRIGVNCHLAATELVALQRKLMEGLKVAAFSTMMFLQDFLELELLEILIDL